MDTRFGGCAHRGTFSRLLLVLSLLLVASACSIFRREQASPFDGSAGERQVRIDVDNQNFNDATLHAIRGGERHRLGIVVGKTEASFTLDWPMSAEMEIEIDYLASHKCVTPKMFVDPGDILALKLEEVRTSAQLRFDCQRVEL